MKRSKAWINNNAKKAWPWIRTKFSCLKLRIRWIDLLRAKVHQKAWSKWIVLTWSPSGRISHLTYPIKTRRWKILVLPPPIKKSLQASMFIIIWIFRSQMVTKEQRYKILSLLLIIRQEEELFQSRTPAQSPSLLNNQHNRFRMLYVSSKSAPTGTKSTFVVQRKK